MNRYNLSKAQNWNKIITNDNGKVFKVDNLFKVIQQHQEALENL